MSVVAENRTGDHLTALVELLIVLADHRGVTPVLVTDPHWVLADDFYVSLGDHCTARTGRSVRFDLLPGHWLAAIDPGRRCWADWLATPRLPLSLGTFVAARVRGASLRRLARRLPRRATVEPALAVSRPGGQLSDMVIGLAGPSDELPRFAQEIVIGPVAS